MSQDEIIQSYLPLVDFLAEAFGPSAEIVLHDLRNREHSMIAIRNGHVTGREAGASTVTDFALQLARHGENRHKPYVANYFGRPAGGEKILRSSTFFIRDEESHIIGILGINIDLTQLWTARRTMDQLLTLGAPNALKDELLEKALPFFSDTAPQEVPFADNEAPGGDATVETMVRSVLDQVLDGCTVEPSRMTPAEKREVVEELNAHGVFLLKGVVTEVAQRLEVSEQTVYRYLKSL